MMSWQSVVAAAKRHRAGLWQALATVLATVLSFVIASALHLGEPFWSVITAAIVARATARGAARFAMYRLLGTLAGALFGLAVAFARRTGLPETVLLLLLVAPLGLLGAFRRELRAALIAGIIVFSASHLASPFDPALARIMEVGLGALVGVLVSLILGLVFRPAHQEPAKRPPS
jgi:uncharacterized membrane protein YccC